MSLYSSRHENRLREVIELRAIRDALVKDNAELRAKLAKARADVIEEAAMACKKTMQVDEDTKASWGIIYTDGYEEGCDDCAAAVRSLAHGGGA